MVIAKVLGIFAIVLVGFIAGKAGWLEIGATKPLSMIVINIAMPCMMVATMAEIELVPEKITAIIAMFLITLIGYMASWGIGLLFNKAVRVPRTQHGIYINSLMYTNNGFMGFAVTLAIFGKEGLFLMLMINCISPLFMYTMGAAYARRDGSIIEGIPLRKMTRKDLLKDIINMPIIGSVIGLLVYFFQIPIAEPVFDVLSSIGALMTPLAMMVIGLQLTQSNLKDIIGNRATVLMTVIRLLIIPIVFFLVMLPIGMPVLWISVATLNFLLPAAAAPVAIAEVNGADAKCAAEGVFLSTLFSMITIPIASVLLHSL